MTPPVLVSEVFSQRVANCLRNDRIEFLEQISAYTEKELIRLPAFGKVCLAEVKAVCRVHGVKIGEPSAVNARQEALQKERERADAEWLRRKGIEQERYNAIADRAQARYEARLIEALLSRSPQYIMWETQAI